MPVEPQRRRLQLLSPVTAVKLAEHPGSSLRTPTEILRVIPIGAIVETEGAPSRGLITILWTGDAYSVFDEDLEKSASASDTGAGAFD